MMEEKNVKYEEYVYAGAPLPPECTIDTKQGLHVDDGLYPHRWGLKVGETSREFGKNSYLTVDQKNGNTALLDKLIEVGAVQEYARSIVRKVTNEAGEERWQDAYLTTYYLPYERVAATFRQPTAQEPIECAINVETDAVLEVLLTTGDWSRYVDLHVQTRWPSVSMMDVIEDLEDTFLEWAEEKEYGFSFFSSEDDEECDTEDDDFDDDDYYDDDEEDVCHRAMKAMFFNEMGDGDELEFENVRDLMRGIVSIRLVSVNNKIIERK